MRAQPCLPLVTLAITLVACKETPAPPSPATSSSAAASSPSASASSPSAPPPPPKPIDAALPEEAPHALDRRAECARDACTLAHLVPDEVRPALSDGAPVVIWEEGIGERASVVFPRDEGVELMGVVLDGSLDLTPMDAPTARTVGGRWSAFRAPGGGVTLGGSAGKAARVALVVAMVDRGTTLAAHLDQRDKPGAPPGWNWKVRKKRIDVVSFASQPDLAWGGGAYHARIGWEASKYHLGDAGSKGREVDDQPAAVVDVLRFSADAAVAEHDHPHEWEILAVLEGDGALVKAKPGGGEESVDVRPGAVVTIPMALRHAWKPSANAGDTPAPPGKAPLVAIQVYAPPGPEQRFKKLAGK